MTEGSVCAGPPPSLDRTASEAEGAVPQRTRRLNPRDHHGMILLVIIDSAIWYLARPEPLLVQGEVEGTSIDIAARVSGPPAEDSGKTRRDVAAGTAFLVIDNPELFAQLHEAEAEKLVADAELARINVGMRAEIDRASADLSLAQRTPITAPSSSPPTSLAPSRNSTRTRMR
jgi:multidrug resistance efflux pump